MSHLLWLTFEQLPHPEAVSHPATPMDVRLVCALFQQPQVNRIAFAQQFRRALDAQRQLSCFERPPIPCRHSAGEYHLVSWRLAKWLANVLPAEQCVIDRTRNRLETWLYYSRQQTVFRLPG